MLDGSETRNSTHQRFEWPIALSFLVLSCFTTGLVLYVDVLYWLPGFGFGLAIGAAIGRKGKTLFAMATVTAVAWVAATSIDLGLYFALQTGGLLGISAGASVALFTPGMRDARRGSELLVLAALLGSGTMVLGNQLFERYLREPYNVFIGEPRPLINVAEMGIVAATTQLAIGIGILWVLKQRSPGPLSLGSTPGAAGVQFLNSPLIQILGVLGTVASILSLFVD